MDPELVEASVLVLQSMLSIHVPFRIMQVSKLRRLQTSFLLSSSQAEHFPNVKEHSFLKTFWGGSVQNTILSQRMSSFSLEIACANLFWAPTPASCKSRNTESQVPWSFFKRASLPSKRLGGFDWTSLECQSKPQRIWYNVLASTTKHYKQISSRDYGSSNKSLGHSSLQWRSDP